MFVRTTQRKNADGSVVRYVQLATKARVDGKSVAKILVNLGREDALDSDGLARLVGSINRYLGVADDAGTPEAAGLVGDELRIIGSKPLGTAYLLDGLWHQLGIHTALKQVLGQRRFSTDVERVLFALVANRAIDPLSKLAATEWARWDPRAHHPAHHHAGGHCHRLRAASAARRHRPRPHLTRRNIESCRPDNRGHTPNPAPNAHPRRSTPVLSALV